MRILGLMSDPYHGFGGIAQMNRHLLDGLRTAPGVERVVPLPRLAPQSSGELPPGLEERPVTGSPLVFGLRAMRAARQLAPDVVWCGHLNLLPVAAEVARFAARRVAHVRARRRRRRAGRGEGGGSPAPREAGAGRTADEGGSSFSSVIPSQVTSSTSHSRRRTAVAISATRRR